MTPCIQNTRVVGIDLGTTFTVAAYYDDTGKPKVIHNRDSEPKTPSVVHVGPRGQEVLVGLPAWNMQMLDPERTFIEFKRDLGTDKVYLSEGPLKIDPAWCQTQLLKYVRESAIHQFGDERAASEAVITVPASFNEKARQAVKHSAELAGISVLQLIHEPTAAGLAFGVSDKPGDRLVLVTDFGGGTFDASVIAFGGGEATVLASLGDEHLGGKDVDALLVGLMVEAFQAEHKLEITPESHPGDRFALREEAIRQKHLLSSRTEVRLCGRVEGKQVVVAVTRDRLTTLLSPLLQRIEHLVLGMIAQAKVNLADIKHILLVGGSSRLVAFQDLMKRHFGAACLLDGRVSPDLAIAEGAAIHAAQLVIKGGKRLVNPALQAIPAPAIKHTDVTPHSLGVGVQDRVSDAMYCSVVLPRNTTIPCQMTRQYGSVDDHQTRFKFSVLQGEDGQPAKDCLEVGSRELDLPARSHTQPTIEVAMSYDLSGMVKVTMRDLTTSRAEDITVRFDSK